MMNRIRKMRGNDDGWIFLSGFLFLLVPFFLVLAFLAIYLIAKM